MERELYIAIYPRAAKYAEAFTPDDVEYDNNVAEQCPLCGRRVSGSLWLRPREVVLTSRKVPDFLYCYGGSKTPFLISERVLTVIRQEGLVGIKDAQEIEYVHFQRKAKKEVLIPRYYYVELARSKMTIDHEKSSIVYGGCREGGAYSKACPLCRPVPGTYDYHRHLEFHKEQYEGYDIFFTYELCSTTFLSRRFVDVCRENKLTNLHFTPAEKYGARSARYFLDGIEDDDDEDDMVSC